MVVLVFFFGNCEPKIFPIFSVLNKLTNSNPASDYNADEVREPQPSPHHKHHHKHHHNHHHNHHNIEPLESYSDIEEDGNKNKGKKSDDVSYLDDDSAKRATDANFAEKSDYHTVQKKSEITHGETDKDSDNDFTDKDDVIDTEPPQRRVKENDLESHIVRERPDVVRKEVKKSSMVCINLLSGQLICKHRLSKLKFSKQYTIIIHSSIVFLIPSPSLLTSSYFAFKLLPFAPSPLISLSLALIPPHHPLLLQKQLNTL